MQGSGSGPLGMLMLIVPLAAIPVFAIVGVPHFAPLVASPAEEEEFDADAAESSQAVATAATPSRGRSADDLFAPITEATPPSEPAADRGHGARPQSDLMLAAAAPVPQTSLPPSEALDQWEIRSDAPGAMSRPAAKESLRSPDAAPVPAADSAETLEIPGDESGTVSTEGFSPDLLKLEPAGRTAGDTRGVPRCQTEEPSVERSRTGNDYERSAAAALSRSNNERPATAPEQPGWQTAARRLKELGISKYRLESQIEKQTFVFICTIASADNPRIARRFEADADNPLEAVEIVLAQIDEWRNRDNRARLAVLPPEDDR